MKWKKMGLIFSPDKNIWWQQHYGILPTPIHIPEQNCIRIFFAATSDDRFGRIAFVDVNPENPAEIIYRHGEFVLDTGKIGAFDDCGVNPSAIIRQDGKWLLYFAGYQRHFRT